MEFAEIPLAAGNREREASTRARGELDGQVFALSDHRQIRRGEGCLGQKKIGGRAGERRGAEGVHERGAEAERHSCVAGEGSREREFRILDRRVRVIGFAPADRRARKLALGQRESEGQSCIRSDVKGVGPALLVVRQQVLEVEPLIGGQRLRYIIPFSINGSEFVEMFVGVGAARVRDLFEQARANAPCIIFIDELDALGRARGFGPLSGGHDEKEQTLNQLLTELDGFDPSGGIVLLAATNRPEILDSALLRAGRFDRQILVDRPDKVGRIAILEVHLKKVTLAPDVAPDQVAALTPGFSGADLANLVNEAALLATRAGADAVAMDHFTRAVERIVAGLEKKNRLLNPLEREVVAYHEMGHALVAMSLPGVDTVHKVSIIPRGIGALGYTIQRPTEDRYLMTREELENKMAVLLGGRAAESVVYAHYSTGAVDDLGKATDIAMSMVMRYGMDEKLGNVAYESEQAPLLGVPPGWTPQPRRYSEETAREIDCPVRAVIGAAFERSIAILEASRGVLEDGARALLAKETLGGEELATLGARLHQRAGPEDAAGAAVGPG